MTEPLPGVAGEERTTKSKVLEAGAAMTQVKATTLPYGPWNVYADWAGQDFTPVKSICAHLNAFHVYADDPKRFVETNHYCSHLTEGTPRPCAVIHCLKPQKQPLTNHCPAQTSASASSTTAPTRAPASSASST